MAPYFVTRDGLADLFPLLSRCVTVGGVANPFTGVGSGATGGGFTGVGSGATGGGQIGGAAQPAQHS